MAIVKKWAVICGIREIEVEEDDPLMRPTQELPEGDIYLSYPLDKEDAIESIDRLITSHLI